MTLIELIEEINTHKDSRSPCYGLDDSMADQIIALLIVGQTIVFIATELSQMYDHENQGQHYSADIWEETKADLKRTLKEYNAATKETI